MNTLNKLVNYCKELLYNFPQAEAVRDYAKSRLSQNVLDKFSFGYYPSQENLHLLESEIGFEELSKLGIIYENIYQDGLMQKKTTYSTMQNHNLVMPYKDTYGEVIAIVGRSILTDEDRKIHKIPKYMNTSFNKRDSLFGLNLAKESIIKENSVFVVEGQMDFITAYDKGLYNVVALGSSNMTFEQFALLTRYTDNIILLLDNDDAGNAGSDKIIKNFGKYANIKKGELPAGYKDLDLLLKDVGIEGFNYKIKEL